MHIHYTCTRSSGSLFSSRFSLSLSLSLSLVFSTSHELAGHTVREWRCMRTRQPLDNLSIQSRTVWPASSCDVDLIIHNGAMVHWVYPYSQMKAINVTSTAECLRLGSVGKELSPVHFISSTSVFDSKQCVVPIGSDRTVWVVVGFAFCLYLQKDLRLDTTLLHAWANDALGILCIRQLA